MDFDQKQGVKYPGIAKLGNKLLVHVNYIFYPQTAGV